jgi:hypothetical protein
MLFGLCRLTNVLHKPAGGCEADVHTIVRVETPALRVVAAGVSIRVADKLICACFIRVSISADRFP